MHSMPHTSADRNNQEPETHVPAVATVVDSAREALARLETNPTALGCPKAQTVSVPVRSETGMPVQQLPTPLSGLEQPG